MIKVSWCCMVLMGCISVAKAQYLHVRMDTVVAVEFGGGPDLGRGPAFFPANVLQGPSVTATDTTPSLDAREVCSIGLDGSIILGLTQNVIIDGPGVDFIVFENAFIGPGGKVFAEPGEISVSRDMVVWHAFPFDSLTLRGCAGVTPTSGGDPFNADSSGGDAFDLSDVGVDSVRFIRIRDVTSIIKNNPSHPYYDPTLSGFDLDAITVPHAAKYATTTKLAVVPRAASVVVSITQGNGILRVFDVSGCLLSIASYPPGVHDVSLAFTPTACLIVTLEVNGTTQLVKVLQ